MSDRETSINDLKMAVARFASERNWGRYHTLKNLAMSVSIEAAELMELFQWNEGSYDLLEEDREAVEEELADVIIYSLQLANVGGIDLSGAIRRKMIKNAKKYPVGGDLEL